MVSETEMLLRYLRDLREAVFWKLEGLCEYDLRRPLTPTGTNLLGVVKHLATVELGYFSEPCGREQPVPTPWLEFPTQFEEDLYAAADQSADAVFQLYLTAGQHTEAVLTELGVDAAATVAWWSDASRHTNLRHLSVHVITETARHLGHVDILREQIDGKAGLLQRADNLPDASDEDWDAHRANLQSIAESFR